MRLLRLAVVVTDSSGVDVDIEGLEKLWHFFLIADRRLLKRDPFSFVYILFGTYLLVLVYDITDQRRLSQRS